jgi:hypothetical protein
MHRKLTGKTEVHEDSRDFPVGDMPIKGVVGKLVGWLVNEFPDHCSAVQYNRIHCSAEQLNKIGRN